MPSTSTTLSIIVKLQNEASSAMQGLGKDLEGIGKSMTSVGKTMTTDITLPLVAFATYAAKGAMDFQQAMTLVQTQAGASASEVQSLSKQVMQLATHSQQGPTQLAEGLYHIVSLGLQGQKAMDALKVASEGAAVGQENLADVATALGGAISSGIKGTSNYTNTMGALDAIIGAGNMKMQDLVGALSTGILPAARSSGLALNDVGAALATMTDNGIPAEDAATRLRMTFSLMSAPTKQAQKALASVGLSSTQLATDMRKPDGLLKAIMDLKTHLEDSGKSAVQQNAVIARAFGGGRTSSAILTLLEETDKLSQKYSYLASNTDKFSTSVNVEASTWEGQLQNMNANLQVFRDTVGTSLLRIANQVLPIVTNALQDLVHWWNSLSPGIQKAIVYAAMFAAAVGPVLVVLGTLITSIGAIISGIGGFITMIGAIVTAIGPVLAAIAAVVTAIGIWPIVIGAVLVAVVVLIVTHWNQIIAFLRSVGSEMVKIIQQFLMVLETIWKNSWGAMWSFLSELLTTINEFLKLYVGAWEEIFRVVWNTISKVTESVWAAIKVFFSATWNWVKNLFSTSLSDVSKVWTSAWQALSDFLGNTWKTIKSTVKAGFNDIITAVNGFIRALDAIHISIPSISIPGTKLATPSLNVGFNIPNIPMLADGGFVTRPTLALIGEAGPEAVYPLSALRNQGGPNGAQPIVVNINGGIFPADQSAIKQIGDILAKTIIQQVRVTNYSR